jgi:CheY-like chemotaxis protein
VIAPAASSIPAPMPASLYVPQVVFVGEDDPGMRHLLAAITGRSGRHVVVCADGAMLLDRMERHVETHGVHPALVISDHRMPGRTGIAVLETIRAWGWMTPFVMTTAFPDDELIARVARWPATTVLSKPFPMSALTRAIEHYLPDQVSVQAAPGRPACASCGATRVAVARPRGPVFCEDCEPTGRHAGRGFDALYVEHGGES